jgi:hypothetical protein
MGKANCRASENIVEEYTKQKLKSLGLRQIHLEIAPYESPQLPDKNI